MPLDWNRVKEKIPPGTVLETRYGKKPIVNRITDTYIDFDLGTSIRRVQRTTLETAVTEVDRGAVIVTVSDLKRYIPDDRPSYSWAVLRRLGYV